MRRTRKHIFMVLHLTPTLTHTRSHGLTFTDIFGLPTSQTRLFRFYEVSTSFSSKLLMSLSRQKFLLIYATLMQLMPTQNMSTI